MKPCVYILLCGILLNTYLFANPASEYNKAQDVFKEREEVYFKFSVYSPYEFKKHDLFNTVSVDRIDFDAVHARDVVYAYANKDEFERFTKCNLSYEVLTPPSLLTPVAMSDSYDDPVTGSRFDFYKYPTYSAYVLQMKAWVTAFPNNCHLDTLGFTANNKHAILCMRIAKDINKTNGKIKYLSNSTIHGDEVLNYMNALHMIDTLLNSYGKDTRITKLVDNIDFYIVPSLNPDGTYKSGDNTVSGAQRYNITNGYDLNRNNPDGCLNNANHRKYGLYTTTALETQAMLNLHKRYHFNLASDEHGGAETILWPYGFKSARCCDEDWAKFLSKRFADQVHIDCNNNGYLTSWCGPDGMGNLYSEMYEAHGTRLDYQVYYGHGKTSTAETSDIKLLPESQLKTHWGYLKEAYFQMFELLYTGIQGIVTDSITKLPIYYAKMTRNGDFDSAHVYSDSAGFYCRFTDKGNYTLSFSKTGYVTKNIANFNVADYTIKYPLDVELCPIGINTVTPVVQSLKDILSIIPCKNGIRIIGDNSTRNIQAGIYNINGKLIKMLSASTSLITWDGMDNNGKTVSNGFYIVKIRKNNETVSKSFVLNR